MYLDIKARNFAINYFPYPKKVFEQMQNYPNWEFIVLRLKNDDGTLSQPVSIGACYRTSTHYSPMLLGMRYDYLQSHKVYKQSLFQVLKRAAELKLPTVYFGFSADTDKRKFGARQIPRVAYLQAKDNFNFEVIESMSMLENITGQIL
jgi:hypothetical protein